MTSERDVLTHMFCQVGSVRHGALAQPLTPANVGYMMNYLDRDLCAAGVVQTALSTVNSTVISLGKTAADIIGTRKGRHPLPKVPSRFFCCRYR